MKRRFLIQMDKGRNGNLSDLLCTLLPAVVQRLHDYTNSVKDTNKMTVNPVILKYFTNRII